jgi:hypothetical protein
VALSSNGIRGETPSAKKKNSTQIEWTVKGEPVSAIGAVLNKQCTIRGAFIN